MEEENNMGRGFAQALAEAARQLNSPAATTVSERPDSSSGLRTDFSDKAVRARIETQISGQPRH